MAGNQSSGMRTPLKQVRRLGSAKEGATHFWQQRLTAVANLFLTLFLVGLIVVLAGADHAVVKRALANPAIALLMLLLVLSGDFPHAARHAGDHRGLRPI